MDDTGTHRYDPSIRVYATADTDTDKSTNCVVVSQPRISLDQAGLLENAAYMHYAMGGT